ncbi:MAG: K+/H+ antiporter subunit F [Candidatus Tectomicrobia bacterium]|uniref:K+/H+ antiporter subunit F n=1 Tax=Tectimicrobiota bacterium TaxID=2528274 RepID=A0A932MN48_UNCTE|nr:K+/H+ antiporter subunit F [Candidatus Tectomicrobia bacterium]
MIQIAVEIGMGMTGLSLLLCFLRLVVGPTTADRVVAADTLSINILGLIALFAIRSEEPYFILALLALAILSFVGTVVYAKFLERGAIIE